MKRIIIAMSLAGISFDICAETAYSIPRLDADRIERRKNAVDTKFDRVTYLRYAVMAAMAAGAVYYGYNLWTAPAADVAPPGAPTAPTQDQTIAGLRQEVADLRRDMDAQTGKGLVDWVYKVIFKPSTIGFFAKGILAGSGSAMFARALEPLLDIDALWYHMRSQGDFVRGVIQTAKHIAPFERRIRGLDPLMQEEKQYLCRIMRDSMQALNKQVEKIIAFVGHKQGQFKDQYPKISEKADDQIRYLMVSYDHFAQELEELLNNDAIADDALSSRIVEIAQHFKDDYEQVKERLKDLEDDLEGAV